MEDEIDELALELLDLQEDGWVIRKHTTENQSSAFISANFYGNLPGIPNHSIASSKCP